LAGLHDLMREYERARYPEHRRLDLQAEGLATARDRALQWIQSRAHEEPGQDLLIIVSRSGRPGNKVSPLETEVRSLLEELQGKLIGWWEPFAPGSLAIRIADVPDMRPRRDPDPGSRGEGRTDETSGAAPLSPQRDIPPQLLEIAIRIADKRIEREGLNPGIRDVVLREIWTEAQALAMERGIDFAAGLGRIMDSEIDKSYD
jgi:hypothetical protein